ncbi:MAG TPA: IS1595 family transposase [Caulobacteraceae bacterium]|jgi:transposase-like protein|nr:IS1595 family transposase [Caulobacteraceae bacterium]
MARSVLNAPHFQNEKAAFAYVEAHLWPNGPVCPHCGGFDRISRMKGKSTRLGLHKCYQCRKPFTVRQGSIFESSHLPLHLWLQVIHLMCASKKGISTRQVQRMLQCSMKTAWFLTHRIREAMAEKHGIFTSPLGGAGKIIEADEAFIGRDATKKLKGPGPHFPVMSLVERNGRVRSFHVPNVTANSLRGVLAQHADPKSRLMTDDAGTYAQIGWNFADHGRVTHSRGEYVSKQDATIHTNTVEGYFSILKRGIFGTFHHVSEAHLSRYLSEFDYRYNTRSALGVEDVERAYLVVIAAKGKRLTYETTSRRGQGAAGFAAA